MPELTTPKFGIVSYAAEDLIRISGGIPGFRELESFVMVINPDFEPIRFLQSVENAQISFPLIDPRLIRSDYQIRLSPEQQDLLGLSSPHEGVVYSIVTLSDQPEKVTANLFAPLVFNHTNRRATQVILVQSPYSVAEPVLR